MRKLTTKNFISKARQIHGNKYDYSKFEYINNSTKSIIICPLHGSFYKNANKHLLGQGCPNCTRLFKLTTKIFIERSKLVHNKKYNYSKVNYINNKTKVCIICPEHGEFYQNAGDHLRGSNCPKCSLEMESNKKRLGLNKFIEKANKIHNNKYNYSKVNYINNTTKVCIVCPDHGDFWQIPHNHLQNHGCPKCNQSKGEKEIELWLNKNNIQFVPQKRFNNCRGIRNMLPFDFYLPEYNTCIEFDGEQHYTGTFNGKSIKNNDSLKTSFCEVSSIRLVRIPYWDIRNIDDYLGFLVIE